jgi:glycosyltransferase 2 family protein
MELNGTQKTRPRKRALSILIRLVISVLILGFLLIYKTSVKDILGVLAHVRPAWLALAFSLHAVGLLASAFRWRILAHAQGDEIPLGFLMKSLLVGTFFGNFLPSSFGGDIVRIWDGSRYSKSLVKSSAIIAVERLTGIIVLFLFALFASLFRLDMARRSPVIWVSLGIGFAGLACVAAFLMPGFGALLGRIRCGGLMKKAIGKLLAFRETILVYRQKKGPLLKASAWALILQTNVVIYFFFIGKAFRLDIGFADYFIFVPIVLLIQIIPVSINGLGLTQGATIEIFKYYAIAPQTAFSFSLIDVGFRMLLGIAGGIIYISRK